MLYLHALFDCAVCRCHRGPAIQTQYDKTVMTRPFNNKLAVPSDICSNHVENQTESIHCGADCSAASVALIVMLQPENM